MTKSLLRNLVAKTSAACGLLHWQERKSRGSLSILCYHRILPKKKKEQYFCPDLVVQPETFREHCQILQKYYCLLPLHEAVQKWSLGNSSKPILAITFDDGYVDNLLYAAPILQSFGLRATFFIISGLTEENLPPWYDFAARCIEELNRRGETIPLPGKFNTGAPLNPQRIIELAKTLSPEERKDFVFSLHQQLGQDPNFEAEDYVMNAQQLVELASQGHEIGAHSVSHEILPALSDSALKLEIANSRQKLESIIQQPITSFCYPNGDFDNRCLEFVRDAGYQQAVTTENGSNVAPGNPFLLKRRFVHEQRLATSSGKPSAVLLRSEASGLSDLLFQRKGVAQ